MEYVPQEVKEIDQKLTIEVNKTDLVRFDNVLQQETDEDEESFCCSEEPDQTTWCGDLNHDQ